ncbi:hypothetical protein FHY55_00285 [Oceanicola sp. D3]|uniref:hypothetical protein n=1 Tax=Oceanicola sp. D3 TaxID=2587163 RepID=UPI00111F062E|nr:hypothetical protein [Oceanicola sp. D3]QDC07776.1 hypothetical protein FHY55_00285 [Oceanicola sp. D3]
MEPIEVEFKKSFWPSGTGEIVGWIECDITSLARRFHAAVISENGLRCILLRLPSDEVVSITEAEEHPDTFCEIYLDASLQESLVANTALRNLLSGAGTLTLNHPEA